ncbi:MAG TPA: DUF2249 domain-containing protein [Candidatus Acidoferrum sp.]|nr:DUF2249 domain-containing protein [Candidatus Acidoferrum sp.]
MHNTSNSTSTENLIGPDRVMDVREIPCSIKHGLILRTCAELPVGSHFILLNGRDPAHLREEMAAWWPGAFAWEYLVQQPDEVRVKLTKLKAVAADAVAPGHHECSH